MEQANNTVNAVQFWMEHATFLDWATNVSAFAAVAILGLVIYGFRRYINRPRGAPIDYIGTGIWILCLAIILRFLWRDVLPDITQVPWREEGPTHYKISWIFNVMSTVGGLYLLKGFHLIVDARAPGKYSILTAVFYPKRLRLWVDSNPLEEDNE